MDLTQWLLVFLLATNLICFFMLMNLAKSFTPILAEVSESMDLKLQILKAKNQALREVLEKGDFKVEQI